MGKSEFVSAVADKSDLNKTQAAAAVDAFIDVVTESLKKGEEVQFTGFGKFSVQKRAAREGINPQTKEKIQIKASKVPKFSAGSALKAAVKKQAESVGTRRGAGLQPAPLCSALKYYCLEVFLP